MVLTACCAIRGSAGARSGPATCDGAAPRSYGLRRRACRRSFRSRRGSGIACPGSDASAVPIPRPAWSSPRLPGRGCDGDSGGSCRTGSRPCCWFPASTSALIRVWCTARRVARAVVARDGRLTDMISADASQPTWWHPSATSTWPSCRSATADSSRCVTSSVLAAVNELVCASKSSFVLKALKSSAPPTTRTFPSWSVTAESSPRAKEQFVRASKGFEGACFRIEEFGAFDCVASAGVAAGDENVAVPERRGSRGIAFLKRARREFRERLCGGIEEFGCLGAFAGLASIGDQDHAVG